MKYSIPRTMEEYVLALRDSTPQSKIVSGGTDFFIALRKGKYAPDMLISPYFVPELKKVSVDERTLYIGAMATMTEVAKVVEHVPEFWAIADAASNIGTPQIRNRATVAGNICNASPAGDMLPTLWIYEAGVDVLSADGCRKVIPISQFVLGPNKNALEVGQAVVGITFDRKMWSGYYSAFRKVGFRKYVSISRESAAVLIQTSEEGIVKDARIALGAVGSTPIRAYDAELILKDHRMTEETIEQVSKSIAEIIEKNCRPTNRQYKTIAAQGLVADTLNVLQNRKT